MLADLMCVSGAVSTALFEESGDLLLPYEQVTVIALLSNRTLPALLYTNTFAAAQLPC